MEAIIEFIQSNVAMAPWLIFGLLLLAGFNLPVSEDAMIFISAVIAKQNPELTIPLFLAVYLGAYFSELICFALGWFLGPKILKVKMFSNIVTAKRRVKIHSYYEKYGIITLILGRFIPFGVRNGLFLTAGLGKMNPLKFCLSDLLACTISCLIFFTLYYQFGTQVVDYVKKGNLFIFGTAAVVILILLFLKKKKKES